VEFAEDDFRKLLKTINNGRLGEADFKEIFDTWWPKVGEKVQAILSAAQPLTSPHRSKKDLLEEVVNNTRAIIRELQGLSPWHFALNPEVEAAVRTLRGRTPGLRDIVDLNEPASSADGTVAKSE
jgi:hypothetical protein